MQERHLYEYAVIRFVPKVEREEFINMGIVLFSKQAKYLKSLYTIDENKLKLFSSEVRVALLFSQFLVGKSSLFFLFLLFQGIYHLVNGDIPFCFAHAGKRLQGVLQMDGVGIRHQFIENLRTVGELFVVFTVLV